MIKEDDLPNDMPGRVFYVLAQAAVALDNLLRELKVEYTSATTVKNPPKIPPITIRGKDFETVRLMWTVYQMLCDSLGLKAEISVKTTSGFDPKNETGWFDRFGEKSLHDTVILPLLGKENIKCYRNERERSFGHHIPDTNPELKTRIQKLLCEQYFTEFFEIKNKTILRFRSGTVSKFFNLGLRKCLQVFSYLPTDVTKFECGANSKEISENIDIFLQMMELFPNELRVIDFSFCPLHPRIMPGLFNALPKSVDSLSYQESSLLQYGENSLIEFIKLQPKQIRLLDLSNNNFEKLTKACFIRLLTTLGPQVESLNMESTKLPRFSAAEWAEICDKVPSSVVSWNLNYNSIILWRQEHKPSQEELLLASSFTRLHKGLKVLNIGAPYPDKTPAGLLKNLEVAIELSVTKEKKQNMENYAQALCQLLAKFDVTTEELNVYFDKKADVNSRDPKTENTLLMVALEHNNEKVAEYLLSLGANPLLKNKRGQTARNLISRNALIMPILKGYELLFLTLNGNIDTIRILLRTNDDIINFQGQGGYTALLIAVEKNAKNLVECLLEYNADPSITLDDGRGIQDLTTNQEILDLFKTEDIDEEEVESSAGFGP